MRVAARRAALVGGDAIRAGRRPSEGEAKGLPGDWVTEVDVASETAIQVVPRRGNTGHRDARRGVGRRDRGPSMDRRSAGRHDQLPPPLPRRRGIRRARGGPGSRRGRDPRAVPRRHVACARAAQERSGSPPVAAAGTVPRVRASAGTGGGRDGIPLPPEGPASEVPGRVHRGVRPIRGSPSARARPASISPGRRAGSSTVSSSWVSHPGTSRPAASWWKKPAGASPTGTAAPTICRATSWPARRECMTSCAGSRGTMGRRDRDRIRVWAEGLVQEHGAAVARLIGLDPPLPSVTIEVDRDGPPGVTGGRTITLSERLVPRAPGRRRVRPARALARLHARPRLRRLDDLADRRSRGPCP